MKEYKQHIILGILIGIPLWAIALFLILTYQPL